MVVKGVFVKWASPPRTLFDSAPYSAPTFCESCLEVSTLLLNKDDQFCFMSSINVVVSLNIGLRFLVNKPSLIIPHYNTRVLQSASHEVTPATANTHNQPDLKALAPFLSPPLPSPSDGVVSLDVPDMPELEVVAVVVGALGSVL